ncbi:20385_t:CDS:2 [Entrophospora sp. SA101]|nr:16163_t:CDS:2 [Entrophospora sp. SA101]CAJ0922618.1 20385_t:CDS:2 [Entrophospora sp. SA101]
MNKSKPSSIGRTVEDILYEFADMKHKLYLHVVSFRSLRLSSLTNSENSAAAIARALLLPHWDYSETVGC